MISAMTVRLVMNAETNPLCSPDRVCVTREVTQAAIAALITRLMAERSSNTALRCRSQQPTVTASAVMRTNHVLFRPDKPHANDNKTIRY